MMVIYLFTSNIELVFFVRLWDPLFTSPGFVCQSSSLSSVCSVVYMCTFTMMT